LVNTSFGALVGTTAEPPIRKNRRTCGLDARSASRISGPSIVASAS
jgi:hypothetical protein